MKIELVDSQLPLLHWALKTFELPLSTKVEYSCLILLRLILFYRFNEKHSPEWSLVSPSASLKEGKLRAVWASYSSTTISQTRHVSITTTNSCSDYISFAIAFCQTTTSSINKIKIWLEWIRSNMPRADNSQTVCHCIAPLVWATNSGGGPEANEWIRCSRRGMGVTENTTWDNFLQIHRFKVRLWSPKWKWRHWGDILLQRVLSKGDRGYDYLTRAQRVSSARYTSGLNKHGSSSREQE